MRADLAIRATRLRRGRNSDGYKRRETGNLCGLPGEMESTYCIVNKTKESFLGLNVACASTLPARLKALVGKLRISPGEGLWVVPSRGVRTLSLLFPIDLICLDTENRVIHLVEHLGPFRISSIRLSCASVLELPPHTIYASQTRIGDQFLICLPEEMNRHLSNIAGGNAGAHGNEPRPAQRSVSN
jgi:uncharacterized membrane protein (UPF0127 family)